MTTYVIFPADYADKAALYGALKNLMDLPDYFGANADALHDVLEEREPVRLVMLGEIPEAIARDVQIIRQVVEDADGVVKIN